MRLFKPLGGPSSRGFLYLSGADTSGADTHLDCLAVADGSDPLDIREGDLFGLVVGMADVVSHLPSLSADLTFS